MNDLFTTRLPQGQKGTTEAIFLLDLPRSLLEYLTYRTTYPTMAQKFTTRLPRPKMYTAARRLIEVKPKKRSEGNKTYELVFDAPQNDACSAQHVFYHGRGCEHNIPS